MGSLESKCGHQFTAAVWCEQTEVMNHFYCYWSSLFTPLMVNIWWSMKQRRRGGCCKTVGIWFNQRKRCLTTLQAGIRDHRTHLSVPAVRLPLHQVALRAVQWCHFLFVPLSPPQPEQRYFTKHTRGWKNLDVAGPRRAAHTQHKCPIGCQSWTRGRRRVNSEL